MSVPTAAKFSSKVSASPLEPLVFQLLNEIGIINQLAQARAAKLLAPGLNMPQFMLLNHFARLGGERSLVRLADAMQVTKAAMTNTVTRMLDKGLLAVRPDPADGRGKLASLTPTGAAAHAAAVTLLGQAMAELGPALAEDEINPLLPPLRRLRAWLDQNRTAGPAAAAGPAGASAAAPATPFRPR